jgi:hypothetical protein
MTKHIPTAHEVETFSGEFVDTKNPNGRTIKIEDIAHALANTCRYGGHCQRFYSVAEHAVFVSRRLERKGHSRSVQLAGLHHDDAEAYLGDIPRPMKSLLGATYRNLSDRMDAAICAGPLFQFNVRPEDFHTAEVKNADNWALFVEARFLLPSQGKHWFEGDQGASLWGLDAQPKRIVTPDYWYGGVTPAAARSLFLTRHKELTTT